MKYRVHPVSFSFVCCCFRAPIETGVDFTWLVNDRHRLIGTMLGESSASLKCGFAKPALQFRERPEPHARCGAPQHGAIRRRFEKAQRVIRETALEFALPRPYHCSNRQATAAAPAGFHAIHAARFFCG
ncbi:hypothetical protein [Burkholderia pseudomultivorans]|uniref:hypothetical protein n=1 Tax=Burkholderia pseudomultivorans TaxID=1207504 RepID=UPI0012DB5D2E|nr:hypothetical protein [Burkholderia pseudomultivorans]